MTTVNIKFDADNVKRVVTEPWRLTDKHGNMVAFDEVRPQCRLFCFYSPDKTSYACRVTSVVTKGTLKGLSSCRVLVKMDNYDCWGDVLLVSHGYDCLFTVCVCVGSGIAGIEEIITHPILVI